MSTNKMADTGSHMSNSTQKSSNKLKYTTFVGNGDVTASKTNENVSLQEAFKRYRKQRQKELRKARRLRKRWELRQGDPDKMTALRMKFIAQAKKYIGVPYAKKYWPPESPEYKSKLFLDCCGLVRQVMRDLVEDFGFYIGPWNQAYMYDTLPITVDNEKDMKPGDLVFISATYFNPKSKKQRHNMTHVEIWAGQGPKTIGSRWNNGKVQIWDDYKFTAKSYYDETYHFKSIDTWLMGICESHCCQHRWKKTLYNPSKKSVFAVEEDDQEQDNSQDEAAGDDDDNVTDDVVSSIRDMKNQIEDEVASIAKGQTQSDGFNEVKVGAKSPMLSIISIQQNIPETDKVKVENKNLIDDGRVSVTGQALPIVSIRQNNSKKTGKAKKGKVGKSSMNKSKDTVKETGKGTNTMATQTEKRVVSKALREKDNKSARKCFDSEESGSVLEVKEDAADEADACKVDDEDQVDGIVTDGEADIGLPVGMSDLYLMEPEASSATGLPHDMTNDALSLVGIKADPIAEALCPDNADIDKLGEGEVSQENITPRIAWVTLGVCPVCKTDLKSAKTNEPCHTIDAMESESNDTILEEVGEEEQESVRGMQRKIFEASLSGKNLTGAEKAHESKGTAADLENCGNTEAVCDNINVTEMNVSNNALPKRTVDQGSTRQTGTAEFVDSNMPCEGCHDVQPSDSDKSLQSQQRENIDNQSVGAISRNQDRSQSRSESSGAC